MARCCGLALVCFALAIAAASATQFRVGGHRGWSVPDASAEPYNAWAGRMRFQIGDQLLFVYPKETDSVLLVEPGAYNACNTTSALNKFDDGSTVFTFHRSGPFFFISGNEANCMANEKLIVVVLADRTPPAVSPPPSSMPPPSAAPVPSPPPPSSMPPPSAAPMPSPPPPSTMPPPSGAPMPSPSSSPPSAAPMPAPGSAPSSAPSPMASAPGPAPTATPGSPPSPGALAPSPSSTSPGTPGGVPQPPSASTNPPGAGAQGENSTTPGSSGAATVAAGLTGSLVAYLGYAMLAV